jgi:hypothetical protein
MGVREAGREFACGGLVARFLSGLGLGRRQIAPSANTCRSDRIGRTLDAIVEGTGRIDEGREVLKMRFVKCQCVYLCKILPMYEDNVTKV